jgi:transposase InsO family protein
VSHKTLLCSLPEGFEKLLCMKTNQKNTQQTVALTKFKAVNWIEEQLRNGCRLASVLRQASLCPWPDEAGRCYAVRTLEDWWYAYQKKGYEGLQPRVRSDKGHSRKIDPETGQYILEQVSTYPTVPVKVLYTHWQHSGVENLPPLRSVYRYLQRQGYDRKSLAAGKLDSGPRKAFEVPFVNDLWMVDFSPGPRLRLEDGRVLSTQLCILIDDHSRLIPYAAYYEKADTAAFHDALKEALLRRGVPIKLYTDQGGPFVCEHTRVVCANLNIRLLHAKPYHAWSKGKVERVIQTVQQSFESSLKLEGNQVHSLQDLNRKLSEWIQITYHQRKHSATNETPELRYQRAIGKLRRLEIEPATLDTLFYTRLTRRVRKNGTVRIKNMLFEVDLSLRAQMVELRFNPFTYDRIEVWYQDVFSGLARKSNLNLNSETGGGKSYA